MIDKTDPMYQFLKNYKDGHRPIQRISESEMFEMRGVWNHSHDVQKYNTTHAQAAEKIYTYIRKQIIDRINKSEHLPYTFDIPDEYMHIDVVLKNGNKAVKDLITFNVTYKPIKNYKTEMCIQEDEGKYTLMIYRPLSYIMFKPTVMHELKHIWQKSFRKSSFTDPVRDQIESNQSLSKPIDIPEGSLYKYPAEINKITDYIYRANPDEYESYRDDIYSYAFELWLVIKDKKKDGLDEKTIKKKKYDYIFNHVKDAFKYNQKTIDEIYEFYKKYPDDFKRYMLELYMNNIYSDERKMKYNIFSKKYYYNDFCKFLIAKFRELQNIKKDIVIHEYIKYFTYNCKEFMDVLAEDALSNIEQYIKGYYKSLDNIISSAIQDANESLEIQNDAFDEIHNRLWRSSRAFRYISYNDDRSINVEIVVTDRKSKKIYIGIITGETLQDIRNRILLLVDIYNKQVTVKTLFDGLKNILDTYPYNLPSKEALSKIDIPKYKDFQDTKEIIQFINDLDEKFFLK